MRSPLAAPIRLGAGLAALGLALGLPGSAAFAQAHSKSISNAPAAANATCTGALASGNYLNVTAESGCVISSSDAIQGSITVVSGGTLTMSGATVQGSVAAQASAGVSISGSTIQGSVAVQAGPGPVMVENTIGGSLSWLANTTAVYGFGNTVVGSIAISGETGGGVFWFNTVQGSCALQASGITGVGNTVAGANTCNT